MQSFAGKVKNELCRTPVQRLCCARAEAYGVLLYGNTFSPTEVRLITESADFAARLPRLFQRAFGLKFDRLPEEERGKLIFGITDRSKLDRIINQLGYDPRQNLVLHVNFGLLEDECCRTAFLRGAFLAGGSVTDPEKRYHLELDTGHAQASREVAALLTEMGFLPHSVRRGGQIGSDGGNFAVGQQNVGLAGVAVDSVMDEAAADEGGGHFHFLLHKMGWLSHPILLFIESSLPRAFPPRCKGTIPNPVLFPQCTRQSSAGTRACQSCPTPRTPAPDTA